MEEEDFREAREDLAVLEKDYEEAALGLGEDFWPLEAKSSQRRNLKRHERGDTQRRDAALKKMRRVSVTNEFDRKGDAMRQAEQTGISRRATNYYWPAQRHSSDSVIKHMVDADESVDLIHSTLKQDGGKNDLTEESTSPGESYEPFNKSKGGIVEHNNEDLTSWNENVADAMMAVNDEDNHGLETDTYSEDVNSQRNVENLPETMEIEPEDDLNDSERKQPKTGGIQFRVGSRSLLQNANSESALNEDHGMAPHKKPQSWRLSGYYGNELNRKNVKSREASLLTPASQRRTMESAESRDGNRFIPASQRKTIESVKGRDGSLFSPATHRKTMESVKGRDGSLFSPATQRKTMESVKGRDGSLFSPATQRKTMESVKGRDGSLFSPATQRKTMESVKGRDGSLFSPATQRKTMESVKGRDGSLFFPATQRKTMESVKGRDGSLFSPATQRKTMESVKGRDGSLFTPASQRRTTGSAISRKDKSFVPAKLMSIMESSKSSEIIQNDNSSREKSVPQIRPGSQYLPAFPVDRKTFPQIRESNRHTQAERRSTMKSSPKIKDRSTQAYWGRREDSSTSRESSPNSLTGRKRKVVSPKSRECSPGSRGRKVGSPKVREGSPVVHASRRKKVNSPNSRKKSPNALASQGREMGSPKSRDGSPTARASGVRKAESLQTSRDVSPLTQPRQGSNEEYIKGSGISPTALNERRRMVESSSSTESSPISSPWQRRMESLQNREGSPNSLVKRRRRAGSGRESIIPASRGDRLHSSQSSDRSPLVPASPGRRVESPDGSGHNSDSGLSSSVYDLAASGFSSDSTSRAYSD